MVSPILPIDAALRDASRVPALGRGYGAVRAIELGVLALAGIVAALLTNLLRLRLGIPGSNILFAVLPLAVGFALVPRRGAGAVMTGAALATTAALGLAGIRLDGVGALTSLLLTGPLLDLARRRGDQGWRLYAGFIVAGTASNAAAFVVRATAKVLELPGGGGPLPDWWPRAIVTYAVTGLAAGLLSAVAWFRLRPRIVPGDTWSGDDPHRD